MESEISVLLRDGTHAGANIRLALKAEQVSTAIARTPIQIAPPKSTQPDKTLMDLGINKTSITISGIIDNIGTDLSQTTENAFFNMEILSIGSRNYYIPYKNYLEKILATSVTDDSNVLQLEIGDATTPDYSGSGTTASTGGAIYEVAVQRVQFTLSPGREDRWVYSIQFLAKLRTGIAF